jgi:hypothetical protein
MWARLVRPNSGAWGSLESFSGAVVEPRTVQQQRTGISPFRLSLEQRHLPLVSRAVGVVVLLVGWFVMRPTVSQPVRLSIGLPFGAHASFFLYTFCRDDYFVVLPVGRPLWREDGSVTCSAIADWSGSWRTNNQTLPSHLRLCSLFVASYD